jgi:signal transduction histidine kinase
MSLHTILVVDDDPMFRRSLATRLASADLDVLFAENGTQGLALLRETSVDIVLLDVMLPDMDGFQFCQTMRRDHLESYIPVIMITALSDQQTLVRSLEAGADDFVNKWVSSGELRARISAKLRIRMRQREMKHLSDFREDILQMIVHDMCNPVQVIEGYSSLLAKKAAFPTEDSQAAQAIHRQSRRLRGYLEEILTTARLQANELTLHQERVNLTAMMREVVEDHDIDLKEKDIIVDTTPQKAVRHIVDARLMRRVLDNLLDNAIKYSPRKSRIAFSIKSAPEHEGMVSVEVADRGPGIPDASKPMLFTKFGIIPTLDSGVRQIGLGLAFCRLVVEAHGGSIAVTDNPGGGSIFSINLRNALITATAANERLPDPVH